MKKDVKKLLVGSVICSAGLIVSALAFTTASHSNMLFSNIKADDEYILVLNSGNAMNGNGEKTITSTTGGDVRFTYTNVSSSSGNHCAITNGGTIVNKDIIHSITSFQAEFTGTLQARIAYNTSTWGGYFDLTSNETKAFSSKPYFLEIKATSNVVLKQAKFTYTCEENPDATGTVIEKAYSIKFNDASSDGSSELSTNVTSQITQGEDYVSSASSTKAYQGSDGLKLGSSKAAGSIELSFDSTKVTESIDSITVEGSKYGSDGGKIRIEAGSHSAEFQPQSGGNTGTLTFPTPVKLSELEISTTTKRAYLRGIDLNYTGQDGDVIAPREEVGISATDDNIHKYTTESIFDNDNALAVSVVYSDSTTTTLAKGGSNGYSYVIKDSEDHIIDTSKKFPAYGEYSLIVSYSNFTPVVINFEVSPFLQVVDVTASMAKVTYTTANVLNDYINSNLTALINFDDQSTKNITYAQFADYNLDFSLSTPRGFTYDPGVAFGTAGTWTLKVFSTVDSTLTSTVELDVQAILVTEVSLDKSTAKIAPNGTVQLVATVGPDDATNKTLKWESNNKDVATVDTEGLVTGVADGQATITATAADGSNVFGSCVVTVETPTTPAEEGEFTLTSFSNLEAGQYVVLVGYKNSSYYAMGEQRTNNRAAVEIDSPVSNKITRTSTSEFVAFRVVNGDITNTFAFYDGITDQKGYLYAAASGSNYLRTQSGVDANASFNSSFAAHGSNSCKNLRLNTNQDVFSCYSSTTMAEVSIYAKSGSGTGPTPVTPVYPTSVSINGDSSMTVNTTQQLSVNYTPNDTNVKNVTYTSSDTTKATVSSTGVVTALAAGSVTITASAATAGQPVTATKTITINNVAVTGVSVDPTSVSIKAGKTATLVPTITPSNAGNKNVTYTSNNTSVATVSSAGVVTGIAAGSATITVTTVDGGKTATCAVTVTASSGGGATGSLTLEVGDMPEKYGSSTVAKDGINFTSFDIGTSYVSDAMQWRKTTAYLYNNDPIDGLNDITISSISGKTFSATIYSGTSENPNTNAATLSKDTTYSFPANVSYFKIVAGGSSASYSGDIVINYSTEPIEPTAISLSPSTLEITAGNSKQFTPSYSPSNANCKKGITWTSSNTNVATVDGSGNVTVKSTAAVNQTSTITATLTELPTIKTTATVKVVEEQKANHTVMIYMCGADLESKNGLASGDIAEILKISGQPDDVNIIIETGGASSWASTYGISSTNLERWHIENRKLVRDDTLTYASMGLTSTFQSFLKWGLSEYPADRTGVILWNHGGGMRGVCYDEKKNDDVLKNSEVKAALTNATAGSSDKLEWIGYDACLMSVQDIAEFNSSFFNYQISSEESEAGYGWDYDNWVDDLYAKKTTPQILKAIVDSFIADNGGANSSSGDQTLSYLDLSKMSAYKSAWETMASALNDKITSSNKSSFNTAIVNNVKHYADADYDYFCLFDAKDFLNKLANNSAFNSFKVDASAAITALNNLVAYNLAQKGAGQSYGICMYWPNSTQYSDVKTYYTTSETNFTNWRSICVNKGVHA